MFSALVLLHDAISSIIYYMQYDRVTLIRFGNKFSVDSWIFRVVFLMSQLESPEFIELKALSLAFVYIFCIVRIVVCLTLKQNVCNMQ
jgi:hypothetical protein